MVYSVEKTGATTPAAKTAREVGPYWPVSSLRGPLHSGNSASPPSFILCIVDDSTPEPKKRVSTGTWISCVLLIILTLVLVWMLSIIWD